MGKKTILITLTVAALALSVALPVLTTQPVEAAGNPCNPCGGKKEGNPCNPCGGKNPCNSGNPCGGKKKASNPCNPCGM